MVMWGFGQLQYKAAALMDVLPLHHGRRLAQYKPLELSLLLGGYAKARHYHASLLDAAAPVSLQRGGGGARPEALGGRQSRAQQGGQEWE